MANDQTIIPSPRDPYRIVGQTFANRYRIDKLVGTGGMGAVYKARHLALNRVVAIKILRPDVSFNNRYVAELFQREGMVVARLSHPNIVAIYDADSTEEGIAYIVMEWLEGHTLDTEISQHGPLGFIRTAEILRQVSSALKEAHSHSIVHRDLKPHNIMLTQRQDGQELVKVLDFGIAKILDTTSAVSMVAGTPLYMSPEQFEGAGIDGRADIYSLGVTLFEMLTGRKPFEGRSLPDLIHHLKSLPLSFTTLRPDAPEAVEKLLNGMMARLPEDRPQRVGEIPMLFEQALGHLYPTDATLPRVESKPREGSTVTGVKARKDVDSGLFEFVVRIAIGFRRLLFDDVVSVIWRSCAAIKVLLFNILTKSSDRQARQSLHHPATPLEKLKDTPNHPDDLHHPPVVSFPSRTSLSDTLSVHLATPNRTELTSPSSTISLRHSEVFRHDEEHIFEELILHKDYERLWRSLIHAGGVRNLLTGYGPFGGTSLLKCAIAKARMELQGGKQGDGALLVFYFRVTQETAAHFEIEATDLGFSHVNRGAAYSANDDMAELEVRGGGSDASTGQVLTFSLDKPLGVTFFAPSPEALKSEIIGRDYDFSHLVADLNTFFKQRKANKVLKAIVLRLAGSRSLRSRVVLIIDKVKHLETLETLSKSDLFSNRSSRVIAVARNEDVDCWTNRDARLQEIGFAKWYIPCLWNIDFDSSIFSKETSWKGGLESEYKSFLKHLAYRGRGSLGNVIAELKQPINTNYGSGSTFVDIGTVVNRPSVQHNAWVQDVLNMNWDVVLGNMFGGPDQDERTDRARIGVYHLFDWIIGSRRFTLDDVIKAAQNSPVSISDDIEETVSIINNLLHVLSKNKYLSLKDCWYRIVWNKDRPPKQRKVRQNKESLSPGRNIEKATQNCADTSESSQPNRVSEPASKGSQEAPAPSISHSEPPIIDQLSQSNAAQSQQSVGNPASHASATGSLGKHVRRQSKSGPVGNKVLKTVTETVTKKTQVIIGGEAQSNLRVKILIVFANPKDSDPLRLGEEDRTIRECIKRSNNRDNLAYKIIHAARIMDVQRELLEDEYQIIHFSGHGAPSGQLVLEDEGGDTKLVPQHALAGLLSKFRSIECVILNACYSLGQGKVLALGVPLVVAMDGPISDDAAKHFTRGFYDSIGAGKDCRFAYQMGCDAISLEDCSEALTPKCFESPLDT
jgi:serine/threonine protein kinase